MSPLWRDQIRVALCPDQVVMVRLQRGWRPKVVAKYVAECTSADGRDSAQALASLAAGFKGVEWQKADATVVLSNHFVRYLVLPWGHEQASEEENLALVRHNFAEVYGDAADWEFRWSEQGAVACVASAVERQLVEGLREVFKGSTVRLRSVQPYLMSAFNGCRGGMKGDAQWFLLGEPGRICLARFQQGQWRDIRNLRIGDALDQELSLLVDRELLRAPLQERPEEILLHFPEQPGFAISANGVRSVRPIKLGGLTGFSPDDDRRYGMAMTGML